MNTTGPEARACNYIMITIVYTSKVFVYNHNIYTMEPQNKDTLGTISAVLLVSLSSFGGSKCIRTIGNPILGP